MSQIQRPVKSLVQYETTGLWLLNTKLPWLKTQAQATDAKIARDVAKVANEYQRVPWTGIDVVDIPNMSKNKYRGLANTRQAGSTWGVAVDNHVRTLVWEGWRLRSDSLTWSDFITAFIKAHTGHASSISKIRHILIRDVINNSWNTVVASLGMRLGVDNFWRAFTPSTQGFGSLIATDVCKGIIYLLGQHKAVFDSRFTIVQIRVNSWSRQMVIELGILTPTGFVQ